MLNIQRFVCNMLQENCYVVSDETKECVIVDCGVYYQEERKALVNYIRDNGLVPKHLIATHGHLDHNFGNNTIYEEFGLKVELHHADEDMLQNQDKDVTSFYGLTIDYEMPPIGKLLTAEDTIEFGSHRFTIIETPGHSKGSVFFYCEEENIAFSGDTLFHYSVGRTDLKGGSMFMLIQSLRMICQLPDKTTVFPGHGEKTTIGVELAGNPYLDR
jgi:glyoxylase-like metal-dependent hydrolase (beta-lactamase superfamily II)